MLKTVVLINNFMDSLMEKQTKKHLHYTVMTIILLFTLQYLQLWRQMRIIMKLMQNKFNGLKTGLIL